MSFAKLTGEPLDKMDCRHNAPRIYAAVVKKPEDFKNVHPITAGEDLEHAIIPQVRVWGKENNSVANQASGSFPKRSRSVVYKCLL